jgi:hypothetical protein
MKEKKTGVPQGTLGLFVLKALFLGSLHKVGRLTAHRTEYQGDIPRHARITFPLSYTGWRRRIGSNPYGESDNNRETIELRLTKAVEHQFAAETAGRQRIALAVTSAVKPI